MVRLGTSVSESAMERSGSAVVRVVVADDQTLFRSGLTQLLNSDDRVEVVGEGIDGLDAVHQCEQLHPDVALLDLGLPRMDGLEATRQITRRSPLTKVLILTTLDDDPHVRDALSAGASGYVLKTSAPAALISSILAVHLGEFVLARSVARRIGSLFPPNGAVESLGRDHGLTNREVEILRLVANGIANKEIASSLQISDKTVRNHMSNVYAKLGVSNRSQIVLYAMRSGLVRR